jgi:4-hydroxy-2-oxoheptanedioate aldolase
VLRPNEVKRKLAAGEEVHGLFGVIPDPAVTEMIGHAGYDFVILDTEHTLVGPERLEHLIRAAETCGLTPFVRVPEGDPGAVLRALDAGAMGIVVPHVRTRADIDATVRAARYAPEGMRSLNGGRGPGYGTLPLPGYLAAANDAVMVIALIEDAEGVDAIDAVLTGGGVDLVLPGPGDLSQSYGVPWQVRHPRVREAVRTLHAACARHGVPFCAMATTEERRHDWRADGVTAFVLGEDRDIVSRALRAHRETSAG